jgi:uncharacterized membrane protein YeaQ/YmgE (transglycosylase-associated protein family)
MINTNTLVDLIILLIAGIIGGNAAGRSLPKYDLGVIGNTIAGAIGGVVGGQILQPVIVFVGGGPMVAQLLGSCASGVILTIVVGVFKRRMASE